ncbi:MAG: hybrid sensor histidine kinase/response regulator [Bacteroidetes bacterium]|nr:hybrid sensor histidine kinase/response regulator [Bacteroidota bacterium]
MWKDNVEKVGFNIDIEGIYYDNLIISCNEGELKTVFYNILKNSIESMQIGGKIKIVTTVKENQAIVSIQDTGIGMDEETKLKIFQPFYSTKGFEAGRGLGMSGVFSIINTHGGNINVKYSELGKGTIIELRFPYENQKALIVKKEAAEITTKSSLKLNILIVEDVTSIRENFVKLISLLGHQCVSVESGMKALELMESSVFDIVFTDIGMPEMNGWQLADAIKEKFDGKMTVVVVSGWEVSEEEKQKYGVAFALNKPFAFSDLKNIIAKLSTKN